MILGDVVSRGRREGRPFRLSSTNNQGSFPPFFHLGSRDADNAHDCFAEESKAHNLLGVEVGIAVVVDGC